MQFSQGSIRPKLDVGTSSDKEWDLACIQEAGLKVLLANGAGRGNVIATAKQLGLSTAMMYRLLARVRKESGQL